MSNRVFDNLARLSAIFLATSVGLGITAHIVNPWDYRVSLRHDIHFGLWGRTWWNPRLVVFNDDEYGPYRGSIIGPPFPASVSQFGETAGLYYRQFAWPERTLWTLMLSLWYPIFVFSMLPAIRLARSRRSP